MNFSEYATLSRETAIYPASGTLVGLLYISLGIAGEAGEFCDKVKKILRDNGGIVTEEKIQALKGELGDILWYIAQAAHELNLDLDDVAQKNIEKLHSRKERGKLQGSGDQR